MYTVLLLATMSLGQCGGSYRPETYIIARPVAVITRHRYYDHRLLLPQPGYVVYSWHHQGYINPRNIDPSHRRERLSREMRVITEESRKEQLRDAVRALYAREGDEGLSQLLADALNETDYEKMRKAVAAYKYEVRKDDPNWGGK